MEYKLKISPSLLAADFGCLADAAVRAEKGGARALHVDYMDGHYVPNIAFGIDLIPALKKRVNIPLEAHLMISNAEERLDDFLRVCPDYIILQEDALNDCGAVIKRIMDAGIKPGLALNPDRPLSLISGHLPNIEYLLVLGVFPGFGGQKFIVETLKKMEEAHAFRLKHGLSFDIAVDGGVNIETAAKIKKVGANVLVAGTAIFGAADVGKAIQTFMAL